MAARAWVVFVVGIIAVYAVYTVLGTAINFIFGVYDYTRNVAANAGVKFDPQMDDVMFKIKTFASQFWEYSILIVFFSMVVYVLLESMRRRPEDFWG